MTKPTQEQAEQYCELIAGLLENPLTDRDSRLSDASLETAQDLLLELNRDEMADALRFNKAQLAAIILNSKPDDQMDPAPEGDEQPSGDQPEAGSTDQPQRDGLATTTQWFEQYKAEWGESGFKTGEYLNRLLFERERAKNPQQFERSMVALAIATLLESKETPDALCRDVADTVIDLHDKVKVFDVLDPDNVRESFPLVIDALAADEAETDERLINAIQLGNHFAAILENPETPVEIHNSLTDALNDMINDSSPGIAGDVRTNWKRIAVSLVADKPNTPKDDIEARLAELLEMDLPSNASNKVDDIIFAYQQARKTNGQEVTASE